jgi:hypothetical protein
MATWLYIGIRLRAPGLKHSLPTLYLAVHPFHPIPHSPFRSHAMFVVDSNLYLMCVINIGACTVMERKIKILIDLI